MKWLVIGLFFAGLLFVVLGSLGYRRDARNGQSADVAMGNMIPEGIGFLLWVIDAGLVLAWGLYRLMFT